MSETKRPRKLSFEQHFAALVDDYDRVQTPNLIVIAIVVVGALLYHLSGIAPERMGSVHAAIVVMFALSSSIAWLRGLWNYLINYRIFIKNPSATPEQIQKLERFWENVDHTDENQVFETVLMVKTQMAGLIPLISKSALLVCWIVQREGEAWFINEHWYLNLSFMVSFVLGWLFMKRAFAKKRALQDARR